MHSDSATAQERNSSGVTYRDSEGSRDLTGSDKPVRVLLLTRNSEDAELLLLMLHEAEVLLVGAEGQRFSVRCESRLTDASRAVLSGEVDVVLLDCSAAGAGGSGERPGAAGEALDLTAVRALASLGTTVPIITLVADEDLDTAAQVVQAGAQDYLVKRRSDGLAMARAIMLAIGRQRAAAMRPSPEQLWLHAVEGANEGLLLWNLSDDSLRCSGRAAELLGGWCQTPRLPFGEVSGSLARRAAEVVALPYFEAAQRSQRTGEPERGGAEFSTSHLAISEEALAAVWFERVAEADLPLLLAAVKAHVAGETPRLEQQIRLRTADDGTPTWLLIRGSAVRDDRGEVTGLACLVSDISARKATEEQLTYDAFHDSLTGLANRALFMDRLKQLLARANRRPKLRFAVLFFDLDGFKAVNDSFGHAVGDKLLVAIARRLEQRLRPMDAIARFGGDELAILINDSVDLSGAVHVAERIQSLLAEGFEIDDNKLVISASIGIVLGNPKHSSPEEILRQADTAMYRAKAAGKGQYEIFDRDMHRSAVALLRLEEELRQAVKQQQFIMYYQPIIQLKSGRITGFEGLVRWQHPRRGLVEPSQFITVAEESGLIVPIGWWVLQQSCRQIRSWQDRYPMDPPLSMSVNISKRMFMQADMVDRVVEVLQEFRLQPETLRIEIREHVVVDDGESAITKLLELRAIGVRVTVDDFGTGYSSLAYLRRFQCESIKIDPSFVSRINQAGESRTLVEGLLTLADTMGLGVIAEGIETADQFGCLRELRCPHGQGFWFAKPLPPAAAEQLIAFTPRW